MFKHAFAAFVVVTVILYVISWQGVATKDRELLSTGMRIQASVNDLHHVVLDRHRSRFDYPIADGTTMRLDETEVDVAPRTGTGDAQTISVVYPAGHPEAGRTVRSIEDAIKQIGVSIPITIIVLALVAVGVEAAIFRVGRRERALARMGEAVEATVAYVTTTNYISHVHYSFFVNGIEHHGSSMVTSGFSPLPFVGDTVPVLYDADDIGNNMLVAAVRYEAVILN